jgi:hypothetical protein
VDECLRCLVLLKIYRNCREELFVRMIRNSEFKMNEIPVLSYPLLKMVFILFV